MQTCLRGQGGINSEPVVPRQAVLPFIVAFLGGIDLPPAVRGLPRISRPPLQPFPNYLIGADAFYSQEGNPEPPGQRQGLVTLAGPFVRCVDDDGPP